MLAKKNRLSRKQIGIIHKRGRRFNFGAIGVKYLANNQEFSRYAINVSTSVYKKAVDRNRLRRIIYDEVGKLHYSGYDFIIGVFRPMEDKDARKNIQQAFKQIAL